MPDTKSRKDFESSDLLSIMSTESGRNVIRRILDMAGVDGATYDEDPRKHLLNEGRRLVGLELRDEITAIAPDKYFQLLKERLDE